MKPLHAERRSQIRRAFPIAVGSVDVRGLLTRRAFVGGFCSALAGAGAMLPIATARAIYPDRPVRIVVPFLPGFGASTEPPGYSWSAGELAADVARFLDALKIRTCHLIGAKYGGSVCMQLASEYPYRVDSLCLFGSPVRGSGSANADSIRTKGVRQWAAETMRARLGSSASAAQIRWWTEELMGKANPRAALGASSARIDMELEDKLSRITAPTLIVTTKESGLQSVEAVERYAARIPSARVIVLPGDSFHIAAVEPELCAQHALRFMAEVSRPKQTAASREVG